MKILSHSGTFHADDVFGTLVLEVVFSHKQPVILRSRDPLIVRAADATVDVGGISDPTSLRFDHHQKGFSEQRDNGVGYASAGLVWKEFGGRFVQEMSRRISPILSLEASEVAEIARSIDRDIVQYVDMVDNGVKPGAPGLFGLSDILSQFNPSLIDDDFLSVKFATDVDAYQSAKEELQLMRFKQAMNHLYTMLMAVIRTKISELKSRGIVLESQRIEQGKMLILTKRGADWKSTVHAELPEVLLVVYQDTADTNFYVQSTSASLGSFDCKLPLPENWAGLRGSDLAAVTGVGDSVFCHVNRHIAGAHSIEGAISLGRLALK